MVGTFLNINWTYFVLRFGHTIPVHLVLLAPVLLLIGGGYTVAIAVIYAIAADVESDANRFVYCRPI
jgi:hypothetical protein